MCHKLTAYARELSENGMVFVACDAQAVVWLRIEKAEGGFRNLLAVGLCGHPVRHIREAIAGYFADR